MSMHWIKHIVEPKRLFLTWMPPQGKERRRYVVAELNRSGEDASLHYSTDSQDYKKAIELNFQGYPGLSLKKTDHKKVLDVFMRRLPPRERRDFGKYLEAIRLRETTHLSNFALLGYSGAKLPDDDFDIIHPFENSKGPCELLSKIAGFRHYDGMKHLEQLQIGMEVKLEPEPNNLKDPQAVRVVWNKHYLGYINRVQAPIIGRWIQEGKSVHAVIERKNGLKNHPRIYLFISIR